jgi:hypothetical protein
MTENNAVVFIVTSGEYSDYGINAVFSTRELAQAYVDLFPKQRKWKTMDIEEWTLDPNARNLKQGRKPFLVHMKKNGDTLKVEQIEEHYYVPDSGIKVIFAAPQYEHSEAWGYMTVQCFADNKTHAVKIANEKRLQLLASNQWFKNQSHESPL